MHYNHVHSDLTVASKGFNAFKVQRYVQVGLHLRIYLRSIEKMTPNMKKVDPDARDEEESTRSWHGATRFRCLFYHLGEELGRLGEIFEQP